MNNVMENDESKTLSDTMIIRKAAYIPRKETDHDNAHQRQQYRRQRVKDKYEQRMSYLRSLRRTQPKRIMPHVDSMNWVRQGHGWDTKEYEQHVHENGIPQETVDTYRDFMQRNNIECKRVDATKQPQEHTDTFHLPTPILIDSVQNKPNQSDTGANTNATPHLHQLRDVIWVEPATISSAEQGARMTTHAVGTFDLVCNDIAIPISMHYCPQLTNTIVSPTAVAEQHSHLYSGYHIYTNLDSKEGSIRLISREGDTNDAIWHIYSDNGLWYHQESRTQQMVKQDHKCMNISAISAAAKYELWHQRLAHCGTWALENMHHYTIGVPKLKGNSFYKCPSCMSAKLATKQTSNKKRTLGTEIIYEDTRDKPQTHPERRSTALTQVHEGEPGQHFHMDFGFVSSNEYQIRTEEGRNVTSIDGKRAYLLVVDRATRYMWTYITETKEPPIDAARMILSKFKSDNPHRTVRTDQDSALSRSTDFRKMVETEGFIIEETGTDNSTQNSRAERPHRDLAQMMRCMLHSSGLGPEYWTYALAYATYLKNRIPHKGINKTPYEALTGAKPDLSGCRIFGARIYARETGNRQKKLDNHSRKGIYLGPTATKKNVTYLDEKTGRIKIGSHVIFDEAHTTVPAHKTPLAAEALQRLGYTNHGDDAQTDEPLTIVKKCPEATTPNRSTAGSIGYDICATLETPVTIQPNSIHIIPTGLSMKGPPGTYIRIAPRSGNTIKKNLTTMAGVIDRDYTGEIKVVMFNFGKEEQVIEHGDKIAQAIVEQAVTPEIQISQSLDITERGQRGFGSSDEDEMEPLALEPQEKEPPALQITKMESGSDIHLTYELLPYDIELTSVPYDNYTSREIKLQGADPLLGMVLHAGNGVSTQPRVGTIRPSTPAAKLKRWRRDLLGSYIISIENELVKTKQDIIQTIQKFRNQNKDSITIQFATIDKQSIHPQMGLPQLYHDQLNVIAEHLWALKNLPEWSENVKNAIESNSINISDKTMKRLAINKITKQKKLTRRILKQQDDWNDWRLSEFKQLDQYQAQGTFGKPQPRPAGANVLDVLWTYLTKDDGTKKARCVCNGAKNRRGTVTLAETYAASLDQTSAKIFWAASAILNFIQIGADATNAFAEAPPPKAPLYVTIDEPYREWYKERFPNEPPIPKGSVLRVHGALQGHPESPRLWATLIDSIIKKLGLKSCKHEPNLYYCSNYNNTGKKVLFLRQVDDFAVSCQDHETAKHVIEAINTEMTIQVKELGTVSRFNGVDIQQTRHYIKLYNRTYLQKIFKNHPWLKNTVPLPASSTPMADNSDYQRNLETAKPLSDSERKEYEEKQGFTYRQAIGELIYALVTCRPDIAFAVIKLSQYSTAPAEIHYEAVKRIFVYLHQTIDEGIYYWRKSPRLDLPIGKLPHPTQANNYEPTAAELQQLLDVLYSAVDSDFAGDTTHRKSVSGICIKLAGGVILYKTKYQPTIALSSTEAEFNAAVEAGKHILNIRSILEEIGLSQSDATILYEDNQGALLMANAQRPTKHTRHIDIKQFALQEWVMEDLIALKRINTSDNCADALTKATGKTIFHRHMDFIMGKIIPEYAKNMVNNLTYSVSRLTHDTQDFPTKILSTGGYDTESSVVHQTHSLTGLDGISRVVDTTLIT